MLIAILVLSFVAIAWWACKNNKEHFGGKVKNMKRIPKTTCYGICDQYFSDCMVRYGGLDAGYCMTRQNSCKRVCDYSDFMVV